MAALSSRLVAPPPLGDLPAMIDHRDAGGQLVGFLEILRGQ